MSSPEATADDVASWDSSPQPVPTFSGVGGGRSAPRSRSGCWTCRTKKVKCDEGRPQCRRCLRLKLLCDYTPRRRGSNRIVRQAIRPQSRRHPVCTESTNGGPSQILTASNFQLVLEQEGSRSLASVRVPLSTTGACSLELTATDHESIRYFRTSFAKLHHTKNPDYSLFSVMFSIAQVDPIVMHMILAISGREIEFRRNKLAEEDRGPRTPLHHYSCALRMMADAIGKEDDERFDLDSIHTVVYLMLLYEQKYGDDKCTGVVNHLNGVSLILQHRCSKTLQLPSSSSQSRNKGWALARRGQTAQSDDTLSLYSARLLVWIALYDAAAASYGVGGQLNGALYKLMNTSSAVDAITSPFQPLENFDQLHRFSNPLYRTVWGDDYPQTELLDDVENRSIFSLLGACGQLRFMIAQLAKLYNSDTAAATQRALAVESAIQNVNNRFSELMEVATELSINTDSSHRLVANIRSFVPHYYAVVLEFLRLRRSDDVLSLSARQRNALREIMNLAFQAYKHEGDEAMMRIAWPLFMVALETDDLLHRHWVLQRFKSISKFGKNFDRAHNFLVDVVDLQSRSGKWVDVRERFQTGHAGLFVI